MNAPRGRSRTSAPAEIAHSAALLLIVFAGHLAFGANTAALSLLMSLGVFLALAWTLIRTPASQFNHVIRVCRLPAMLFLLVLTGAAIQLTEPWPGAAHPVWDWVDADPAITLDKDATTRELIKLLALGAVFLNGVCIGVSGRRGRRFFRLFLVFAALYCAWIFAGFVMDQSGLTHLGYAVNGRLRASFLSGNSPATVFGVFLILALAQLMAAARALNGPFPTRSAFYEAATRRLSLPAIGFLLALTCLALTASRGGLLATAFALLVFLVWSVSVRTGPRSEHPGLWKPALIIGAVSLAVLAVSGNLASARFGMFGAGIHDRAELFAAHWQAFRVAPLWGYGLGAFYAVNDMIQTSQNYVALRAQGAAHNVYLQWLEEGGLMLAIPMFLTIAVILWGIVRGAFTRMRSRTVLRGVVCASVVILVHGMSDYALQTPSIAMMWAVILGVGTGLSERRVTTATRRRG